MNLIDFFKKVVRALQDNKVEFAVAGGLIASIYRENERTTNDLDFLIFSEVKTQEAATSIIKQFKRKDVGLNFILPDMPWFEEAIKRAQYNKIDFGFGPIPCLTKEDVIISKFYSLKNDQKRFNDLDDLQSIFQMDHEIDMSYICGQMQKLMLLVPESLKDTVPKAILLTSKRILRKFRKQK